jgi:hypothetical protein
VQVQQDDLGPVAGRPALIDAAGEQVIQRLFTGCRHRHLAGRPVFCECAQRQLRVVRTVFHQQNLDFVFLDHGPVSWGSEK